MPYIPHTKADEKEMLATIGVDSIEALFHEIPDSLQFKGELNVPSALDERAILTSLGKIGAKNHDLTKLTSFLGAGVYEHYVPSIVMELISRGEFLSAYTPYQPEVSQGYLQTIYEFQSMIAEIAGMEVCNASMYDGATALAEATIMASGIRNRTKIIVCNSVHPHYRDCVRTFAEPADCEVIEANWEDLKNQIDENTACVAFQYPDFFGRVRDPRNLIKKIQEAGALAIAVCEPVSLGVLEPPGKMGADCVVGEAQALGVPMGYGGPMVGYFCVKREFVRAIPGRIVGRTQDAKGNRGFVMTLRTREQDIRREKATSNICTNQALMALCTTVWMAAVGKNGFRSISEACIQKAHYAAEVLTRIPGVSLKFPNESFGFEFLLDVGKNAREVRDKLLGKGFLAGLPVAEYSEYESLKNCLLIAVTEVRTKSEIDNLATELAKVVN